MSSQLSPQGLRYVKRAEKLLAKVRPEDWDDRTPHTARNVPTLAKAWMLLALARPMTREEFYKSNFNPDQLRDDRGRWMDQDGDPGEPEKNGAGTGKFDVKGAVTHLNQAADRLKQRQIAEGKPNTFGEGRCAHYVANAIEQGGDINGGKRPSDAKDFGAWLEGMRFNSIASAADANAHYAYPPSGYTPKIGDVVVIQPYPGGNPAGHMAMYSGSQWVSDFRQRDIWPGPGYRKYQPPYVIYRRLDTQ
jgi:hypothetical protein